MKKKCYLLSLCSFLIALAIYAFTYYLYHYISSDGSFDSVFHGSPAKPFVTLLFGIWGVLHQFAAVMCLLIGIILPSKDKTEKPDDK